MKNKNILAWALLWALVITSWAYAATNTWTVWNVVNTFKQKLELTDEQKAQFEEIKALKEKVKNWETLTTEEQAKLDEFKANVPERNWWEKGWFWWHEGRWWKGWEWMWMFGFWLWIEKLTDEEKTQLESMTDEQKKAFFETKRAEIEARQELRETVIDKLLAWTTLTSEEETVRQEIISERTEIKAKKAEMEEIRTIMKKYKSGETLTTEEQAKLDEFKANIPERKEFWKRWFGKSSETQEDNITSSN